ncbi:hypothetical protein BT93_B0744 [Corymbia citriodora subsp. variegata]|nr:hypothetical protein BT93_B0744 [Corymbia citriodora subsp. variegata]
MSRHRRQASLVLPPEIIAGDDPAALADPSQPAERASAAPATHGPAAPANERSAEPQKAEESASASAAANSRQASLKKPPVAGKDA